MLAQMEDEGFGHCTNTGACEAECPKEISVDNISKLNKEYFRSLIKNLLGWISLFTSYKLSPQT